MSGDRTGAGPPATAPVAGRVGWNLLWLVPGVVGGSEEYTTRLLRSLADRTPTDLQYVIFANELVAAAYPELADWAEVVVAPVTGASKPRRVLAESTWLARAVVEHRVGLVHHLGGIVPARRPTPVVLTIHDLQPLAMPEHFSFAKRRFSATVVPRSVRAAAVIVTLTEHTRRDLVERLGADPARIVVVPPGFDQPSPEGDGGRREQVRRRYRLDDAPYFLYPAITYPHKNHRVLIEAFARLHRRHPEARLVLTGGAAQCEGELLEGIDRLGITAAVRRTGRIPADDLDVLYREAAALTFPSRYEGFGLPVLEAMSRGCPVIAAAATALPEVVADAGLLVDPDEPDDWSEAMATMLSDGASRAALVEAGFRRSHEFDWAASAAVLEDVYRRQLAAGEGGR